MDLLECRVMPYAWGSRSSIAEICERKPSGEPEAELWMGAHPVAPSTLRRGGVVRTLDDVIREAPEREIGARVAGAFGPRLPFLLKVLAAAEPLSLQAHPSAERAAAGFADEEARGVPLAAPQRSYKDPSHKPELICALTAFEALAGFRPIPDMLALFAELGVDDLLAPLQGSRDAAGLAATFGALMTLGADARARAVARTVAACKEDRGAFAAERALVRRLAALHPGDIGIVSALLLQPIRLAPGEAIHLGAGGLHAYLDGTGVEIMASSDNVLRGGLTKKHVDVPELLAVLDFAAAPPRVQRPRAIDEHEAIYDTPASEFRSSVLRPHGLVARDVEGPEILFVTEGRAVAVPDVGAPLEIERGRAAFVPAEARRYELSGASVVYRASTNLT